MATQIPTITGHSAFEAVDGITAWHEELAAHYNEAHSARNILDPIQKYRHSPAELERLIAEVRSETVQLVNTVAGREQQLRSSQLQASAAAGRIYELEHRIAGLESLLHTAQQCATFVNLAVIQVQSGDADESVRRFLQDIEQRSGLRLSTVDMQRLTAGATT